MNNEKITAPYTGKFKTSIAEISRNLNAATNRHTGKLTAFRNLLSANGEIKTTG